MRMKTKKEIAKEMLNNGDVDQALKYVAKFPFKKHEELGQKIQKAKEVLLYPGMYKQLKIDVDSVYKEGIEALFQFLK